MADLTSSTLSAPECADAAGNERAGAGEAVSEQFLGVDGILAGQRSLGATDFDYAAIDRALGHGADDAAPVDAELVEGFRAALSVLVDLVIPPGGEIPPPSTIGLRLIALLQLVRPEALHGRSMREIAQSSGVTRAALSKILVSYSDTFGFWARHQRSPRARLTYVDVQRNRRVRDRLLRLRSQQP